MTDSVRRIGFAYNPTIEAALELRERATGWAAMRGLDHWATTAADYEVLARELPGTDVLVVLGGDGTFLRAARAVADVDVPLLGINVGKVGFLSKVEAGDLVRTLDRLEAGRYTLEHRMALEGRVLRASAPAAGPRISRRPSRSRPSTATARISRKRLPAPTCSCSPRRWTRSKRR